MKEEYRINYLHRLMSEESIFTSNLSFSNYFIVEMPESMKIREVDIVSIDFNGNNSCEIVIRNNFENYPLFTLNEYLNSNKKSFFRKNKDVIKVKHLDKSGSVKYLHTLTDISVKNMKEGILTYEKSNIHTIILNIKYKKRIIEIA